METHVHRRTKFLATWPVTALRAGQSAARQRRCATVHSGWDHGVATVAARSQRVPTTDRLWDGLVLAATRQWAAPAPTHRHHHGAKNPQARLQLPRPRPDCTRAPWRRADP